MRECFINSPCTEAALPPPLWLVGSTSSERPNTTSTEGGQGDRLQQLLSGGQSIHPNTRKIILIKILRTEFALVSPLKILWDERLG